MPSTIEYVEAWTGGGGVTLAIDKTSLSNGGEVTVTGKTQPGKPVYLEVYNAQVALFNAKMSAYQTEAQVYETRLKAELSKIEVFKAEIEVSLLGLVLSDIILCRAEEPEIIGDAERIPG